MSSKIVSHTQKTAADQISVVNFDEYISLNLNLNKIKELVKIRRHDSNFTHNLPFNLIFWNLNTINERKIRMLNDLILDFHGMTQRAQNSITKNSNETELDVLVIVEMGKKVSKFNVHDITGYKLYSLLRHNRKGGGIGIYVKNQLNARTIHSQITDDFEILCMEISKQDDKPRHIIAIYRPPSGKKEPFFSALENLLWNYDNNVIICGDINIDCSNTSSNASQLTFNMFNEILVSFNLSIINKAITRFNKLSQKHTIIDHIITGAGRNDIVALTANNNITEKYSDHNLIFVRQYGKESQKTAETCKTISKVNKKKAIEQIKNHMNSLPMNIHPINQCDIILDYIQAALNSNTSNITIKSSLLPNHEFPPWVDAHYLNLCNHISNLDDKIEVLKKSGKPCSKLKSKMNEIQCKKEDYGELKTRTYYNDKMSLNIKESWNALNQLSGTSRKTDSIVLEEKNIRLNDDKCIAEIFQEYFLSIVGRSDDIKTIPHILGEKANNSFSFTSVSYSDVENSLRFLDIGKATGIDGISPFIWTQICEEIAVYVQVMINQMFAFSTYPLRLKETIIRPILKKGSSLNKINYRPVSITTALDKVVEGIMLIQIEKFMSEQKLMDKFQYGFKKGRSCEDLIAKVLSIVTCIVENKKTALIISLDLSKAFDLVNHEILLAKLEHYGIRGSSNDLIKSFLNDRVQYVKINQKLSEAGRIHKGIPQGTQLGPLLFSIYTNDMKDLNTHSKILKFADDTLLIFELNHNTELEIERIESDLRQILKYYENNRLTLNLNKSQAMIVGKSNDDNAAARRTKYDIKITNSIKYLGVELDDQLTFDDHRLTVLNKINQSIGVVAVLRRKLTVNPLLNFYYAHFQSSLIYSMFVLIRSTSKDIQQLQIKQNKIIKMIFNLPPMFPTLRLYTEYASKTLPVMGLLFNSICVMVKKSLLENDEALINMTYLQSNRTKLLKIPRSNSKMRQNDIEIIGATIFNSLPENIRSINSLQSFKTELKKFLLSKVDSLITPQQIFSKNKII